MTVVIMAAVGVALSLVVLLLRRASERPDPLEAGPLTPPPPLTARVAPPDVAVSSAAVSSGPRGPVLGRPPGTGAPAGRTMSLAAAMKGVTLPEHLAIVTGGLGMDEWDRRLVLSSAHPLDVVRADLDASFAAVGYDTRWVDATTATYERDGHRVRVGVVDALDIAATVEQEIEALPAPIRGTAKWLFSFMPTTDAGGRKVTLAEVGIDAPRRDHPTVAPGAVVVELTPA